METIQHPVVHDRSIPFILDETIVLLLGVDENSNPIVDYNEAAKEAYEKSTSSQKFKLQKTLIS